MNNSFFYLLKLVRNSVILWIVILQWALSPLLEIRTYHFSLIGNAYAEADDPSLVKDKNNCKLPQVWKNNKCVNPEGVREARKESSDHKEQCSGLQGIELKDCQEKLPIIQALCEKENGASPSVSAMKACYASKKGTDIEQLKDQLEWNFDENSNGGLTALASAVTGINITMALIAFFAMKPGSSCPSRTMYMVAAAANILAEIYFYFFVDSKLRDMKEEYENSVDKDSFAGQKGAFEYLVKEQEMVAEVHNTKATVYLLLGIAYSIITVLAVLECTPIMATMACTVNFNQNGKPPEKPATPDAPKAYNFSPQQLDMIKTVAQKESKKDHLSGMDHFKNIIQLAKKILGGTFFSHSLAEDSPPKETAAEAQKKAKAQEELLKKNTEAMGRSGNVRNNDRDDYRGKVSRQKEKDFTQSSGFIKLLTTGIAASTAGLTIGIVSAALRKNISNYLMTSPGIAIISAVSSLMGYLMYGFSKQAANEAEEHKGIMQRILTVFTKAMEGKCDTRDDLKIPKCYCYKEDGTQNSDRSNSETCQKLWRSGAIAKLGKVKEKALAGSEDSVGCVTISGQYDEDCKCKKVLQAGGKNLCQQGYMPQQLNNIGNASGMNDVVKHLNNINSGGFGSGKYDAGSVAKNAAKIRKLVKDLKEKNAKLLMSQGYDISKDSQNAKALVGSLSKEDLAKLAPPNPIAALATSAPEGVNTDALKEAREKAGISAATYQGTGMAAKKETATQGASFNFGGSDSGSGSSGKDLNFMEKKYDTNKGSDIVKNESASIWQVISNRYNVTGLRILFDDGTNKPETATLPTENIPTTQPQAPSKP